MKSALFRIGLPLLGGVVVGFLAGCILMAKYSTKVLEISQASDIAQTVSTLYRLREQPVGNGTDLLENRVDIDLIVLSESPGAFEIPEVKGAILLSKEYRTKYPYTNENAQIRSTVASLLSMVGTNSN